jgi:hypothetical protein
VILLTIADACQLSYTGRFSDHLRHCAPLGPERLRHEQDQSTQQDPLHEQAHPLPARDIEVRQSLLGRIDPLRDGNATGSYVRLWHTP